jgi:hypothetical protein
MKVSIEVKALKAAALCAANKKDLRTYLQGVCLSINHRDTGMVYGTNGHILFAGQIALDWLTEIPVPGYDIIIPVDAIKAIPKKNARVYLESLDNGSYLLGDKHFFALEGKYPDITRVVPKRGTFDNQAFAYINPEYICTANDALSTYYQTGKTKCFPLLMSSIGSSVIHNGRNDAVVVVMPMRIESMEYQALNNDFVVRQPLAA